MRGPKPSIIEYSLVSGRVYRNGRRTGTVNSGGYVEVHYTRQTWLVHRLAFHILGVELPPDVDHVNGDRAANGWHNLRGATRGQNLCNMRTKRDGLKGAYYDSRRGTWYAKLQTLGKTVNIGSGYAYEQEAHDAYWTAAQHVHGEFARKG